MDLVYSSLLGVLQGLTEFLPVSSSGHLVIAQHLIPDFSQPGAFFDVILHAGTLFAIVFYFRKTIISYFLEYFWLLVIGSIPAALIGFFFSSEIESLFLNIRVVGLALIVTGVFNFFTDKLSSTRKDISKLMSFVIGVFQSFAIVPGISRSGSTIFAGAAGGIKKEKAAEFSFILSVPAVFGATLLQFFKYQGDTTINIPSYTAGFITAFISGYFAITLVFKVIKNQRFEVFSYYCFILGALALFF